MQNNIFDTHNLEDIPVDLKINRLFVKGDMNLAIISFVFEHKGSRLCEITKGIGAPNRQNVDNHLKTLLKRNLIKKIDKKYYLVLQNCKENVYF